MSALRVLALCESARWSDVGIALGPCGATLPHLIAGAPTGWHEIHRRWPASILLAVGPECGASLARWVAEFGLDGVVGVGLVGVTAPWAEPFRTPPPTVTGLAAALEASRVYGGARVAHVDLGPIEPLRGAAWRARVGEMTITNGSGLWPDGTPHEGGTAYRRAYPLRLVVACATDDGVCQLCDGLAWVTRDTRPGSALEVVSASIRCPMCATTGKALSSASVARELVGDPMLAVTPNVACYRDVYGGITTLQYESRDALAEHGIRDVVERLTQ